MTTTPTPASDDPVTKLLRELIGRDEETKRQIRELADQVATIDSRGQEQSRLLGRVDTTLREIKGELLRQDGQIAALDRRVSGNYLGISAQYDTIAEELSKASERLTNMERATVEISKSSRILHGRVIEDARERKETFEGELEGVRARLSKLEGNSKGAAAGGT